MSLKGKVQAFNELELEWYEKLKSSDFEDIENTNSSHKPLVEWHSFKFLSEKSQIRKEKWEAYEIQLARFINSPELDEILRLLTEHGNNLFSEEGIKRILEMHRNGMTERGIALEMNCSKNCIHYLLGRIKSWMKLI